MFMGKERQHSILPFRVGHAFPTPVTVAERCTERYVFAISDALIVGSNPASGMDVLCVRLFGGCVVLCVG
jgi:predicted nucleic acid-binding protein